MFSAEMELDVIQPYRLSVLLALSQNHALQTIVNIGSQYGIVVPNPALYGGSLAQSPIQYGVAKAALHHMTKELAARLAPSVRVNCVAFGGFAGRESAEFNTRYSEMLPAKRMLRLTEAGGLFCSCSMRLVLL